MASKTKHPLFFAVSGETRANARVSSVPQPTSLEGWPEGDSSRLSAALDLQRLRVQVFGDL